MMTIFRGFWGTNCVDTPLDPLTQFPKGCSCGYGSIPINTIFSGMNIHLPAILMFTRGTRFWHTAMSFQSPLIPFKLWNTSQVVIFLLCTVLDPPSSARWWLSFFGEAATMFWRMIGIASGKEKGEEEQRKLEDSQKTRKQSPLAECNWFGVAYSASTETSRGNAAGNALSQPSRKNSPSQIHYERRHHWIKEGTKDTVEWETKNNIK